MTWSWRRCGVGNGLRSMAARMGWWGDGGNGAIDGAVGQWSLAGLRGCFRVELLSGGSLLENQLNVLEVALERNIIQLLLPFLIMEPRVELKHNCVAHNKMHCSVAEVQYRPAQCALGSQVACSATAGTQSSPSLKSFNDVFCINNSPEQTPYHLLQSTPSSTPPNLTHIGFLTTPTSLSFVTHVTSPVLMSPYYLSIAPSPCCIPHHAFPMLPSRCCLPHAAFPVLPSPCCLPHTAFRILPSSYCFPRKGSSILLSPNWLLYSNLLRMLSLYSFQHTAYLTMLSPTAFSTSPQSPPFNQLTLISV